MTRLYVKTAAHSLVSKPTYTLISLLGLAVAFASLLLIGAYVRSELTRDNWVADHANVYRLARTATFPGQQILKINSLSPVEALWLKQDIPEVQAIARLWPRTYELRSENLRLSSTVVWADPAVFRVLPFPALAGLLDSALEDPDALVISRSFAHRLLGAEQVIGKTIDIDGHPMRIAAVLDDLPGPSHLSIDIMASSRSAWSPFAAASSGRFDWGSVYTYIRITPGSFAGVRDALPAMIDRHVSAADLRGIDAARMSDVFTYELQPLTDIHLMSQKDRLAPEPTDMLAPSGDRSLVLALATIALLIQLMAAANFINIMTARAAARTVEIGIRKVCGASRFDLVAQFIGESAMLAAGGALVGVAAGLLFLRSFGAFLNRDFTVSIAAYLALVICLLACLILTGVLGGTYPGLVMSAFRPAQVLRGLATQATRAGFLRKALVVFQFTLVVVLAVAVVVIDRQTNFALHQHFRANAEQVLYVHGPCTDSLRERVAALPGALGAACADQSLLGLSDATVVPATLPDGTPFRFHVVGIGAGALELYGLKPLAGRFQAAGPGVVINHAALRGLRLNSPEAALGKPLPGSLGTPPEIIGVVDDFPMRSLRYPIGPVVFKPVGSPSLLMVKLRGDDIPQTLRDIEQVWRSAGNAGPMKSQFHDQFVRSQYEDIVRMEKLFTAFAIIAAAIAALGLYGLSALAIERSAAGIGVRKAFGASRSDIVRLMLWQFTTPVLLASLLAWPVSWLVMRRWLQGFAYHIDLEPWIFLAAIASAVAVALAAVIGHALQLSRVRPVVALRHQ